MKRGCEGGREARVRRVCLCWRVVWLTAPNNSPPERGCNLCLTILIKETLRRPGVDRWRLKWWHPLMRALKGAVRLVGGSGVCGLRPTV